MNDVPAATIKKIQTLARIADDLRQGKDFNITRLTILKSLCADPDAAAEFALHVAKKTQQSMTGAKGYTDFPAYEPQAAQ